MKSQIVPDNTVNTQVNQNGNTAEINGGATRGSNLFHSFQDFSIQTGNEAFFNNATNISNIFSRVTGANISNIDGSIKANGNANLFLINPSGIIFGENTRLDIGGSFLATTAETLNFIEGEFNAIKPEQSILTVDIPVGLGFGSNTGNISVEGTQNNVQIEIPSFRIITDKIPSGIQVDPGKDIFLIGGNINFNGGGLQAPGGNIELASVGNNQIVNLVEHKNGNFDANFENIVKFKDIIFDNAAYIDVSSEIAGNINIDGRQILIKNGSAILANTSVSSENSININASEILELNGLSGFNDSDSSLGRIREIARNLERNPPTSDFGSPSNNNSNFYSISLIGADISSNSSGTGNNININTNDLKVFDAAQIRVGNFSNSLSITGDITLNARNILVEGTNNIDGFINSEITSTTGIGTRGNGGSIKISSQSLKVKDGGQISSDNFGFGSAGILEVNSNYIQLKGANPFPKNTSSTGLIGTTSIEARQNSNGASILVKTQKLDILDRGKINVSSFGLGIPGTISIDAEEINIDTGKNTTGRGFSGIVASVNPVRGLPNRKNLISESGDISINTNSLKIFNGARVEADTAAGNSGRISINAQNIELNGTRPKVGSFIGGISTSTTKKSFGNGGDIKVTTNTLKVLNGSIIRAISLGDGDAGNITINANAIEISGFDSSAKNPIASGRVSKINTGAQQSNGGNIVLNSEQINIDNLGRIEASTKGDGTGGEIFINSDAIALQSRAKIDSSTIDGIGGDININTNSLEVLDGSIIRAISLGEGDGGSINVDAKAIEISGFDSSAKNPIASGRVSKINTGAQRSNGGSIFLDSERIEVNDFGRIVASTRGDGKGGEIFINSDRIALQNQAKIDSSTIDGSGGNITIDSDTILGIENSDITANAVGGNGGNIDIDSDYILGLEGRSELTLMSDITASSELGIDGTISINTLFTSLQRDLEPSELNLIVDEDSLANSCLTRRNSSQGSFVINNGSNLSTTSKSNFYDSGSITGINNSFNLNEVEQIPIIESQSLDSPIPAQQAVKTEDGRVFLVSTPQSVKSLVCN